MKKPLIALLLSFSVSALAEVTYEQLLQDPDNIELNQQYIREQLAAGELSQALVSIERVILLKPLDMDARLARAQVLFRLGNMTSAQQELEALDQLPLGERLEEQVDQLLSEVIARQQRWSFEGNVSIGIGTMTTLEEPQTPASAPTYLEESRLLNRETPRPLSLKGPIMTGLSPAI